MWRCFFACSVYRAISIIRSVNFFRLLADLASRFRRSKKDDPSLPKTPPIGGGGRLSGGSVKASPETKTLKEVGANSKLVAAAELRALRMEMADLDVCLANLRVEAASPPEDKQEQERIRKEFIAFSKRRGDVKERLALNEIRLIGLE